MNAFTFGMRVWLFAGSYAYVVSVLLALLLRGPWLWSTVVLSFVILPLMDLVGARYVWNPDPALEREFARRLSFRWLTWSWVPIAIALTADVLVVASRPETAWGDRIALGIAVGLMNGFIGITYAHELIHQTNLLERRLGEVLLVLVSYAHWRVEHVFGHHRHVATPNDPASSRRGESIYAFFPRTIVGTFRSAWKLEAERLGRANVPVWSRENAILRYGAITVAISAVIAASLGGPGLAFFALQCAVAILSLETVNYLEHYGLARHEIGPDRYEATRPAHSWNAPHRVSNFMLINLARHSDHHASASRRYQILRTYEATNVPELPQGYASMFMLALVPPLWFAVMNPIVDRWNAKKVVA